MQYFRKVAREYLPEPIKRPLRAAMRAPQHVVDGWNERYRNPRLVRGKQKIFCIGHNKTGTTSFESAMVDLGFITGNQGKAERLLREYRDGNFEAIIRYCRSAQVFQDFPFSYPETYKHLDAAFPGSKFVLTVRDSAEQWYRSITRFHARGFGTDGGVPTREQLQDAPYRWKGWMWEVNRLMFDSPPDNPYEREALIAAYEKYNESVRAYFADRPDDFLEMNVAAAGSYGKLMRFLDIDSPYDSFPWKNKT